MSDVILTITPDGAEIMGLYSDKIPYRDLGSVEVKRASNVEFNSESQKWEVFIVDEGRILPDVYVTRTEALAAEVEYLNNRTELFGLVW